MSEYVKTVLDESVLRLTLARPAKKNALTQDMYAALAAGLRRAEESAEVRAVLIAAEGDAFTAGNDLYDFAAMNTGAMSRREAHSLTFLGALAEAQKPIVAAVQGRAVGVGVTLLLHCDLVFVAEDAKLSTPFVNLGLTPEAGSSWLLPARIGHARAYAMFALGEVVDGKTAASIGLANLALPGGELQARALAAARELAQRPIEALGATKRLMRDAAAIKAVMQREVEVFNQRLRSAEAAQAFAAFAARKS